jgi:hypothetical protein
MANDPGAGLLPDFRPRETRQEAALKLGSDLQISIGVLVGHFEDSLQCFPRRSTGRTIFSIEHASAGPASI